MEILKPTTPSQRHVIKINDKNLNKKPILKFKLKGLKRSSGRNNSGRITSYHKGGGHKKRYRKINFYRSVNSTGLITSIEYDPNRSANIASVYDLDKETYYYILAPIDLVVGDVVKSGENLLEHRLGYSMPMQEIPAGLAMHNVAVHRYGPSKITRSAGTYSFILDKASGYCSIQLSSGKKIRLPSDSYATLGIVSNDSHMLSTLGKAGRARWLNKRPTVRGVAMNPVDHPNGGGEGKKSGKGYSPWGKPKTKKKKT